MMTQPQHTPDLSCDLSCDLSLDLSFPQGQHKLTLPTGELSFWVEGRGEPVLLIAGYLTKAVAWRQQRAHLSQNRAVISFDHLGLGESRGQAPSNMSDFVEQCVQLLNHLQLTRAHVMGVSMGGMIAQHLALTHPERVLSLALLVTHAGGLRSVVPPFKGLSAFLGAQLERSPERRLEHLKRLLFPAEARERFEDAELNALLIEEFRPSPPSEVRLAQLKAVLKHSAASRLTELSKRALPTLVVSAAQDNLVSPKHQTRLARLLPHARHVHLEGAGHGLLRQRELKLCELLEEHLTHAAQSSGQGSTQSSEQSSDEPHR